MSDSISRSEFEVYRSYITEQLEMTEKALNILADRISKVEKRIEKLEAWRSE